MAELPSIRLAAELNAMIGGRPTPHATVGNGRVGAARVERHSAEVDAASGSLEAFAVRRAHGAQAGQAPGGNGAERIVGEDVAHHVVDPEDLLGLEAFGAAQLHAALPPLAAAERERWVLVLPTPGALGALRGPVEVNRAAVQAGEAVVGATAGMALVPYRVGPAVQWRVYRAERPFLPPSPYDAEREFNEAVLTAAGTLARLGVAAGPRPSAAALSLPPGYPGRQALAADRAARMLEACTVALQTDGASLSAYEVSVRARELQAVAKAARGALCAAITWLCPPAGI